MSRNKFIFDVDGTLTPSRGKIDPDFKAWFNTFCLVNEVYLVSGSDKSKTVEQITEPTFDLCKRVYNCSGSEVWEGKKLVRKREWKPNQELIQLLKDCLDKSDFALRTGNHIEYRTGCLNFSVVGRNATSLQRKEYIKYDSLYNERKLIAKHINSLYDDITATVGGETGIDIHPAGYDKSQIMLDFWIDDNVIFFGDKMDPDGNDYPLKIANLSGTNHYVSDWRHTWELLRDYV